MQKLLAFLNNMDARAWRTVWVSLALFAAVGVVLVLGNTGVLGSGDLEPWLESLRESPWALPATIMVFTLTSFVAAPQFLLAGVCMLAFGPWTGFVYALIGTIIASALHFYLGRWGGKPLVDRYGGNRVISLSRFVGRNDFVASAIVRNVPTAPAIVVNMAFGASRSNFWRFLAGVAVGSVPKIALVAIFGQSVLSAMGGGVMLAVGGVIAVIGIWLTVALAARKAVHADDPPDDTSGDSRQGSEPVAASPEEGATAENPSETRVKDSAGSSEKGRDHPAA